MRVYLRIKATDKIVPFNHQHFLTGTIYKWLGWNDEHGNLSLYSFSRLFGGKNSPEGLLFKNDASLFFSSYHPELIKKIITGIKKDPTMFEGLIVNDIIILEDPDLTTRECFYPGSPIFIKRRIDNNIVHIPYSDPRSSDFLLETLKSKMEKAGLSDDSLEISFLNNLSEASTKMVSYKGINNRASWCPVMIKGKPETKVFAWNVGLGNSTGIGFGAIK